MPGDNSELNKTAEKSYGKGSGKAPRYYIKTFVVLVILITLFLSGLAVLNRNSSKPLPLSCLKLLAHIGVADAQRAIGEMYLYGFGVDKMFNVYPVNGVRLDYSEAFKWFERATKNGDLRGESRLALMYASGKGAEINTAEALRLWRDGAEKGNSLAQYNLGVMYERGEGVPQSYEEAIKWYTRAAEQNQPLAQMQLAQIYHRGWGTKLNYPEAVKWYRKAAEQGVPDAEYLLGFMYDHADGINQDNSEARKWYQKAAQEGVDAAQFNLGVLYETGRGGNKDYAEAARLYREAAMQGLSHAQFNLGVMYHEGRGVKRDYSEAMQWFQKAASQGVWQAKYNIGRMYYDGYGVKKDYQEAAKWFRDAASLEDATDAQVGLAWLYIYGRGVPQSYPEALVLLQKAADHGDQQAKKYLPQVNETIRITPKDDAEGDALGFDKAIAQSKIGDYRLLIFQGVDSKHINSHTITVGLQYFSFAVECDYFFKSGDEKKFMLERKDLDIVPTTMQKEDATFNLTLALMPEFPYPHHCHVPETPEASRIRDKILSRLGMTRSAYDARRLAAEKSSIYAASYFGHIDGLKEHLADINKLSEFRLSALKYAYLGRQLGAFRFLLEQGADTGNDKALISSDHARDRFDNATLFTWLLLPMNKEDSQEFRDILWQYNPKLDVTGTGWAAQYGDIDLLRKMIGAGAPLPALYGVDLTKPQAFDIVKMLVNDYGVSVSKTENPDGHASGPPFFSSACRAAMAGRNDILRFFLEHGADPNGSRDHIPLFCATEGDYLANTGRKYQMGPPIPVNLDTLAILLDAGAEPTFLNSRGQNMVETLGNPNERTVVEKFLADRHIDLKVLFEQRAARTAETIDKMSVEDKARQCSIYGKTNFIPGAYYDDPKKFLSRDMDEALKLCKEAKEAGNADAIKLLPALYYKRASNIIGSRKDETRYPDAVSMYRAAAEMGYRPAIHGLAGCYMSDRCGMKEDFKEAYFWQLLGNPNASDYSSAAKLTQSEIDMVRKRVAEWKKSYPEVHE